MITEKLGAYHQALIVFLLIFMFGGIADYGYSAGFIPVRPLVWSVLFFTAMIPILFSGYRFEPGSIPLFVWGMAYLLMVALSQLTHPIEPIALNSLMSTVSFVALLFGSLVIFSTPFASTFAARAIFWISLISVAISVYEFFNPGVFSGFAGRSGGLYVNPNTNGSILVMSMVLAVSTVSTKYRLLYQGVVFLGVVTTFSRGALLCWILAFIFLQFSGAGSRNKACQWLILLVSIVILYLSPLWSLIDGKFGGEDTSRLDPSQYAAAFSDVRFALVKEAWTMVQARPLTGYGLGIPLLGGGIFPQGPHNMFLSMSIQFGILGGLLFLSLIAILYISGRRNSNSLTIVFSLFLLAASFFSHNMLDQAPFAIGVSLATTLARERNLVFKTNRPILRSRTRALEADDNASLVGGHWIG